MPISMRRLAVRLIMRNIKELNGMKDFWHTKYRRNRLTAQHAGCGYVD